MWVNKDVDIPEPLLQAQRDGKLVIFAGAGVSMDPPSNLPGFSALAKQVASGLLTPSKNEAFDVFLGRVEDHKVDVQTLARQHLNVPGSTPCEVHSLIVDLFRTPDDVRIVTTNFDPHFTTTARARSEAIDVFHAPALPLGRDFSGLVYVHGSLGRREPLVLTDLDFSRAYLIDGYARRFLTEMFAEYVVLFIGYSHSDVVMQYMARGFIRTKERFAFSLPEEVPKWDRLGIRPIAFPKRRAPRRFRAIDEALKAWIDRTRMGLLDHKVLIKEMVGSPPPLERDRVDYARAVIEDDSTLGFFVRECGSLEWFKWVETQGLLSGLFTVDAPLRNRDIVLADWFCRVVLVAHANEGIDFIERHATSLHPRFATTLAWSLAHRHKNVPPLTLKPWIAVLMALNCQTTPHHPLSDLLAPCCAADETIDAAFLLFQFLLKPRVTLQRRWRLSEPEDSRVTANIQLELLGDNYDLKDAWDKTLKARLAYGYRALLPAVTGHIEEAYAVDRATRDPGQFDGLSFARSAIETHEQDRHPDDWEFLVDVARDLLEWLLQNEPSTGFTTIHAWEQSRPQVLQRLAIHGWGKRADMSPEAMLQHVAERGWLYGRGLKHEVYVLVKTAFPAASTEAQRRFIEYSMSEPVLDETEVTEGADVQGIGDYERYNVAAWLKQVAPGSVAAQEHFAALQSRHPDFGVRDHVDFDHYVGTAWRGEQSPVTAADLVNMSAEDAVDLVLKFEPTPGDFRGPSRSGLRTTLQQAATENPAWSDAVAAALVARQVWDHGVWSALLGAWSTADLTPSASRNLLRLFDEHTQVIEAAPGEVADVLDHAAQREDWSLESLDRLERIGERVLPYSRDRQPSIHTNGRTDWLTNAINHPAGKVAMSWLRMLSTRLAADRSGGIPIAQRSRYEALLNDPGPNGVLARVSFASQAHFLFSADPDWTSEQILPLFDWTLDADRAEQAWNGFLTWGNWSSDVFFDRMRPQTIQTFEHLDRLGDDVRHLTNRLAGAAAFSAHDPWSNKGWLWDFVRLADAGNLDGWARDFGRYLQSLPPEGPVQIWDRWLSAFCKQRGHGLPRGFEDREKDAMVEWLIPLKNVLEKVVAAYESASATPSKLQHFTLYQLRQSNLAKSDGLVMGRFLKMLFGRAQSLEYARDDAEGIAFEALAHGASRQDMLAVAESLARLGCPRASELRSRAERL